MDLVPVVRTCPQGAHGFTALRPGRYTLKLAVVRGLSFTLSLACRSEIVRDRLLTCGHGWFSRVRVALLPFVLLAAACAQTAAVPAHSGFSAAAAQQHTRQFLARRGIGRVPHGERAEDYAAGLAQWAKAQAARQTAQQTAQQTTDSAGNGTWTAVGPMQVSTSRYGLVTGRVTSIAADPSDPSGNTLYVGTTGGGVWYSTNAAGPASGVTFTPLTDSVGDFAPPNLGSLSIGAVSVQPNGTGVVLAGTGDPNDSSDSYYGVGILRSANHGQSWTLIQAPSLSGSGLSSTFFGNAFAGFAWSTVSPDTVVAAVTDSSLAAQQGATANRQNSELGIYYSTDAGATWFLATLSDSGTEFEGPDMPESSEGNAATSVVWNPIRKMFYAAIRYHGYYQSSDGEHWSRLANQPGANLNPDSFGNTLCPPDVSIEGSAACPIYRGTIAVQPQTGDMFAITVDQYNNDQGLWRDACNETEGQCANPVVQFSQQIADTALESSDGSGQIQQGAYDLSLAAVPWEDDTILLVGTQDIYRCSLVNGCVWRNTTNTGGCAAAKVAPSQHAIDATFGVQGIVYFGNDGGLWRTTDVVNQTQAACGSDDFAHFQNLNGGLGSLAEVSDFAVGSASSTELLAALGELGTAGTADDGAVWAQVLDGEGDHVAIDPATPQNWFATTGPGVAIEECTKGSSCTPSDFQPVIGASQVGSNEANQPEPAAWMLDPFDSASALVATCRVWRGAADGEGWSSANLSANLISTMLDGDQQSYCNGNQQVRSLTAAVISSGGAEQIYAGMTGSEDSGGLAPGHVFTQTIPAAPSGPVAWTDLTENPVGNQGGDTRFNPGGYDISSVYADPHDPTGETIYATVEGFPENASANSGLYGSRDGGQSWTNLTSNLPPVPANSVLVDPDDSLVVYIATDAGVWYTPDIENCGVASDNCWNILGTGLPAAPATKLAAFDEGGQSLLLAGTYGRGIWQIPLLSAGTTETAAAVTPSSINFGNQQVQTISASQTITVQATGTLDLTVTSVQTTGDFSVVSNSCPSSLAPQASCSIQVAFAPTATGVRTGSLAILCNVPSGQFTVTLEGTGTAPASVTLSPGSLNFGGEQIGGTTSAQDVTISNTGSTTATLSQVTVSGDFALASNSCGTSLAAGGGCTVLVTFSPTASGSRAGALTVTDSEGTQTAILIGTGESVATDQLSPSSLTFSTQQVGTASAEQPVTLTNTGDATLQQILVKVGGDFQAVNNCGASLTGHSSCTIAVSYLPTQVGAATGALTVSDAIQSQSVSLSGNGRAAPGITITPTSLDFGGYGVGDTTPSQPFTLTNNGGVPLSGITASVSSGFAIATNSCTGTLSVGSACTLAVTFTPAVAGAAAGTLDVQIGSSGQSYSIPLKGFGDAFSLTVSGSPSQTITSGSTATYTFTAQPLNGTTGPVAFTCSGAPAGSTCTVNPLSAAFNGQDPISVTLTVVTGETSSSQLRPLAGGWAGTLLCLVPWGWFGLRRRRQKLRGLLLLCVLCSGALAGGLFLSGCGVHASGGSTTSTGSGSGSGSGAGQTTPSGTYTLTVTASMPSASQAFLTRTAQVQLTVE